MEKNDYQLAGAVKIPEEKKDEFNRNVLRLLYLSGIRKVEELEVAGRKIRVAANPAPDGDGIVRFDYSIFEKRKREPSTYNCNTCELITSDRGYSEYGVAMNMVLAMQEAYSEAPCYFLYRKKPVKVDAYADLVWSLTGISLTFPDRAHLWDMLLYFHTAEGFGDLSYMDALVTFPFGHSDLLAWDCTAALYSDKEFVRPETPVTGRGDEIKKADTTATMYYLYEKMEQAAADGGNEKLRDFLTRLLDADLPARERMAEAAGPCGGLAEASLYNPPSAFAGAYAAFLGKGFWEVWDSLGVTGYKDMAGDIKKKLGSETGPENNYLPLYQVIQRESEDEFLEFWGDGELRLSDGMKGSLRAWREQFAQARPDPGFEMGPFLAQLVTDLDTLWHCRLASREFVAEFLAHKDDRDYQKALLVYRGMLDEDARYFPELTTQQANAWVIGEKRSAFDGIRMGAFQSLLTNHAHRQEILGF